jgi:hypothetical protein
MEEIIEAFQKTTDFNLNSSPLHAGHSRQAK